MVFVGKNVLYWGLTEVFIFSSRKKWYYYWVFQHLLFSFLPATALREPCLCVRWLTNVRDKRWKNLAWERGSARNRPPKGISWQGAKVRSAMINEERSAGATRRSFDQRWKLVYTIEGRMRTGTIQRPKGGRALNVGILHWGISLWGYSSEPCRTGNLSGSFLCIAHSNMALAFGVDIRYPLNSRTSSTMGWELIKKTLRLARHRLRAIFCSAFWVSKSFFQSYIALIDWYVGSYRFPSTGRTR